ncbi:S1 family peptidase [Xanthomonas euvesicatoria]|uniref:S1 family peptidase n=1 Tax=Xanthomonas euvesicatoria TaxID=456327 RepID=UPI001C48D630|nr:serine protease [Xanthomonas euvesicatoria]MBV6829936.1 serine protease [Xanthomonas campestris pv. viegasii]
MSTYQPTRPDDSRLHYTGVLVAGNSSDMVGHSLLPLGSGFFVAPFLVLTARHVIDEVSEQFHGCHIHEIVDDMAFGIDFSIQHPRHGQMKWAVMGYGYTPTIDVVALWVELREPAELPVDFAWEMPTLSLAQARVDQAVNALGYPHSTYRLDEQGHAKVGLNPHESSGTIAAIHESSRDRVMLPYPCFEAVVTTKGGMSGGPVFSCDGHVIGVVGSSFEVGESDESEVSYVSAVWPAVGIELRHTAPPVTAAATPYLLQELVDRGHIRAVDRFTSVDAAGTVTLRIPG